MSVGNNLQEMENVVTKGAACCSIQCLLLVSQLKTSAVLLPKIQDPMTTPTKLKDPAATLAQVRDVVNAKAAPRAEEVEVEEDQEVVAEAEKPRKK